MKKSLILIFSSLAFNVLANNTEIWSAQSIEIQGQQQGQLLQKSSQGSASSLALTQVKSATRSQNKSKNLHAQSAIALTQRTMVVNQSQDFWIYDAWITLGNDSDYDGYSHRFTVEFDADTYFSAAEVYARLYLSRGEVFKEFHTTSVFNIYGEDSQDSLVIESELLQGFPSDDYELLIELYDAYTDDLVAVLDGYDDPDLYLIPLESKEYEYTETVVVVREYGGSIGFLSLLLLPILFYRRFKKVSEGA